MEGNDLKDWRAEVGGKTEAVAFEIVNFFRRLKKSKKIPLRRSEGG
jgi:hypothetical protein